MNRPLGTFERHSLPFPVRPRQAEKAATGARLLLARSVGFSFVAQERKIANVGTCEEADRPTLGHKARASERRAAEFGSIRRLKPAGILAAAKARWIGLNAK